jgi:hypothetical protein
MRCKKISFHSISLFVPSQQKDTEREREDKKQRPLTINPDFPKKQNNNNGRTQEESTGGIYDMIRYDSEVSTAIDKKDILCQRERERVEGERKEEKNKSMTTPKNDLRRDEMRSSSGSYTTTTENKRQASQEDLRSQIHIPPHHTTTTIRCKRQTRRDIKTLLDGDGDTGVTRVLRSVGYSSFGDWFYKGGGEGGGYVTPGPVEVEVFYRQNVPFG